MPTIFELMDRVGFVADQMNKLSKLSHTLEDRKEYSHLKKELDDYIMLYKLEDELEEKNVIQK